MMDKIKRFFRLIYERILVKIQEHRENQIEKIKAQVVDSIMVMIAEIEKDHDDIKRLGVYEKSKIMQKIYEQYPILRKAQDQTELTKWIDKAIDETLDTFINALKIL